MGRRRATELRGTTKINKIKLVELIMFDTGPSSGSICRKYIRKYQNSKCRFPAVFRKMIFAVLVFSYLPNLFHHVGIGQVSVIAIDSGNLSYDISNKFAFVLWFDTFCLNTLICSFHA